MKKIPALFLTITLLLPLFTFAQPTLAQTDQNLFSEDTLDAFINLGQYEEATSYCNTIISNPDASQTDVQLASYGLGKLYFVEGNYAAVIRFLLPLTNGVPLPQIDKIYYFLAESYYHTYNYTQAITYYQRYLEISNNLLNDIIYEKIALAYREAGNPTLAIQFFQSSLDASNREPFDNQIRIGMQYEALGDYPSAIQYYDLVRTTTYNQLVVAQMNFMIGEAYQKQENIPMAIGYYQTIIASYPETTYAYQSLVKLIDLGQPIELDLRGRIDYFSREYSLAINAFGNYINETNQRPIDILYYLGVSHQKLTDIETAQAYFEEIIQTFDYNTLTENVEFYGLAYQQLAELYNTNYDQNPSDYQTAIDYYLEFATKYPNDEFSPSFVFKAAELYEINGDLAKAGEYYLSVAQRFQNSPNAFNAIIFSGISYYRMQNYITAFEVFDRATAYSTSPEDHARAFFWKAKTQQALGNTAQSVSYYNQAQNIDYYSYYGLRSEQILNGDEPFSIGMYDLDINLTTYQQQAETWMIQTFNLPNTIDLNDRSQLTVFPEYNRGLTFLSLREYAAAKQEFTSLLSKLAQTPHYLYLYTHEMLELGFYFHAIHAVEDILELANATDFSITPTYFSYIQYGLYYWELIYPSSNQFAIDPFLLLATMWAESTFDKTIGSPAGAHGLLQIMPDTGQRINENLGNYLPDYTTYDLYRPNINIHFGTQYFAANRSLYEITDYRFLLAAYNAGPGNADYWYNLQGVDDMDVFVEAIGYSETRTYIKFVFTVYEVYKSLYQVN